MPKIKKKPYMAWWALPFFFHESNGSRPVRVLMLGCHKPSKLGMPSRPVVVFSGETISQAIPFPGKDLPKLAAGLVLCSAEDNIIKDAKILSKLISLRKNVYRVFDFNKMESIDALRLAARYGENWNVPYTTNPEDLRMLKGAYSYDVLKGHNITTQNLIVVGKDIRYNVPIIIFKKSYRNFYDVMWLWDGGIRLLAGLMFLVHYPPIGDSIAFLSEYELETEMKNWIQKLSEQQFAEVDAKINIDRIIQEVKLQNVSRSV